MESLDGGRHEGEVYENAKRAVLNVRKVSTSFLQRKLGIGYVRAAKLIDMLEESGVIAPADGAKPRKVLVKGERPRALPQPRHSPVSGLESSTHGGA